MTFDELSEEQLLELAGSYLSEKQESVSYGELAGALEIVGADRLRAEYGGMEFSQDDFCSD